MNGKVTATSPSDIIKMAIEAGVVTLHWCTVWSGYPPWAGRAVSKDRAQSGSILGGGDDDDDGRSSPGLGSAAERLWV